MSLAKKTIKGHVFSATNPTAFPRKLKAAPTILPMILGSAVAAFPTSLLSTSASLSNHSFRVPLPFDGGHPAPPLTPLPVMTRTIVAIVIDRAVRIENMLMPCSLNRVRILSAKDASLSRTFSMVCLILETFI